MRRKILLIGFALSIVLFGCTTQPSDEDIARAIEETQIVGSTSTPRATNTPVITEVKCSIEEEQHEEWETTFCDTFDDNSYEWELGLDPDFGTQTTISNGKLIIDYESTNQTGYTTGLSLVIPFWESKDYVVNILGEMDSVFNQCTWGVMVNGFFDTGVSFEINNQGEYFITDSNIPGEYYLGNGEYGTHNAIKWDAPNSITIVTEDDKLTFYINGTLITSYEYEYSNNNDISISLWAAEGVNVVYDFDHILIREE